MDFETDGIVFLEQDRPGGFLGNVTVCSVQFNPIGGHRIKSKWRSDIDNEGRFKIFLAKPFSGQTLPVRIEIKTWLGKIVGRLNLRQN
jgi:hypothetical protein